MAGRRVGRPDLPGTQWRTPSPRLATVRMVEAALVALVLAVVVLVVELAARAGGAALGASLGGVAVTATVAGYLLVRRARSWGYGEREDDLIVRRGLLVRRLSVVPYGRMQYVEVTAGPIERSFGLASVRMHTAAAASDARIPGLGAGEASRLRDQLTRLGEARAAGL